MKIKTLQTYSEKKVAIIGFGKEGKSSLGFLEKMGFKNVYILDKNRDNYTSSQSLSFIGREVKESQYILGEHYLDNLNMFDLIIKTPGISLYHKKVYPYKNKIISNTEIFFENYKGKTIGVTATKGKSSTSTLIYLSLKEAGYQVKLVGNIGKPVLSEVNILAGEIYDYIVYELSSYMLETIEPKCFIAILGNLFECHLKGHKNSFNIYKKAKYNILKKSTYILLGEDLKIHKNDTLNAKTIERFGKKGKYIFKKNTFFIKNKEICVLKNMILKGEHNKKNISSVLGVCDIIRFTKHKSPWVMNKLIIGLQETLKNFQGLPHRLQNIGQYKGITFIDDSISTTPESTIAAIETFGNKIGTIFLGGSKTTRNYDEVIKKLQQYTIKNIVLFPESGNEVFGDISKNLAFDKKIQLTGYFEHKPNIFKTKSMRNAVDFAYSYTPKGKICILSNAAPSFGLWQSFIQRGKEFQKTVQEYMSESN